MTFATLRHASFVLVATTIIACGDATGSADGSISISAFNGLSVAVGQSSPPVQLQLTRVSTTTAVMLSVEGLPTGVTATITPTMLTSANSTATVSLDASGAASPGSLNIIVKAVGGGLTAQASVPVVVHPRPELSLSVDSTSLRVLTNDLVETTVRVERTAGLRENVQLSFDALPDGITGSVLALDGNGIPTGSGNGVLGPANNTARAMLVAASVTPGTYPITLKASSPGVVDKVVTLSLVVALSGTITMNIVPGAITVAHGGNTTARILIHRSSPAVGNISITPPLNAGGFVFAMPRTVITSSDSTFDVIVSATAATGSATRNFIFSASGAGVAPVSGTLTVTTSPP